MSEAPPTRRSLEETAEAAAEAFRQRVGRPPEGVWGAPGRVNLIGEHTDYNKGFVLPIAINRHVVAAIARRADHRLRLWSLQEEEGAELALSEVGPGTVRGWAAYPAGVAWSLAREGIPIGGFELVLHGTVPVASGLSSSAAVECAVAVGLAELHGVPLDPTGLALAAHRAEVEVAGVPCGVMDQMATMLAKSGHALFLDTLSLRFEHVPLEDRKSVV